MKSSAGKIQLSGFNDLFQTGGETETGSEQVKEIALSELHPFQGHPFQVRDDEEMREMADSIAQYGVLVPGIVRPRSEGGYEIIAGHRRRRGCELAGKDTMPVLVRDLDDDEATIISHGKSGIELLRRQRRSGAVQLLSNPQGSFDG